MQQKLNFISIRTHLYEREYLYERGGQHPNTRPAVVLWLSVSQSPRQLYSLPSREGRLNVKEHLDYETEYSASLTACAPLEGENLANAHLTQDRITHDQRTARLKKIRSSQDFMESLQTEQRLVIEMALEKGASNWLTALPLKRYCFTLTKSEFRDGVCIRYNIEDKNTAINFPNGRSSRYHMLSTVRMVGINT